MSIEKLLNDTNLAISEKNGQIKEKTDYIQRRKDENTKYDETYNSNLKKKFLLQEACDTARKTSYDRFATIATMGLQQIFGKDISVEIVASEKNKKQAYIGVWLSLARVLDLGSRGRRFESCHPDYAGVVQW